MQRNNKSVRCQLIQLTFSNALKPVAKRIWTSDPSLRRAPTYCHSLSIWYKVNPYGTLYKTVSDSIWVILNTPSVKLWKLADCLLQLIIGECLDITIDICYMTTMLRTFDHGKQYSIKLSYRKYKIFSCLQIILRIRDGLSMRFWLVNFIFYYDIFFKIFFSFVFEKSLNR